MKISIITPTYNSEQYLYDNLKSIRSQNYKNLEHIFIDNLSKDKTLDILKDYKKKLIIMLQFTLQKIKVSTMLLIKV